MPRTKRNERTPTFRLLRYFSVASLVSIVVVTLILGHLYLRATEQGLMDLGERNNVALTRVFANATWPSFRSFVDNAYELDDAQLRASPEVIALQREVVTQMRGTHVVKVKIYDLGGRTVFSTETAQIGKDYSRNPGFLAAKRNRVLSEISHRDTFNALHGEIRDRDLLSSYIPLRRNPDVAVDGVMEVYTDVTEVVALIRQKQRWVTLGVVGVLSALYGALFLIVRRAEGIIKRSAAEVEAAKERAERSVNELSSYLKAIDQHALVSVTDADGRIVDVNDRFCETSGYRREALLGHAPSVVASPQHGENFFAELWARVSRGETWKGEICNQAKDGRDYWLDAAVVPLMDAGGAVQRHISVMLDITPYKESQQRIMHLATHDALTGLPNRALLQDRIQQALAHDLRHAHRAAVLFIDLDEFKTINDSLGHDVGDLLLQKVAERLVECVRAEDTVARQGGDEFIVLLPSIGSTEDATAVAEKLLAALNRPFEIQHKQIHVGASIGIAIFPDDGMGVDALMKNSDIAMYHAKESGRNAYQFFTASMNEHAMERQALGSDLREALARGELTLHYQPIVELESGRPVSMEVLLRWPHPARGWVSPLKFIPLAESTGLIVPLGEWVLRTACMQLKAWQVQGYEVPCLAVNISARQFQHREFFETVCRALEESGVAPQLLELEITEGLLIEDADEVKATLAKLRAIGVHIALDDFGTGYSSLSYLKRFPIDTLKIDRSFVLDIARDPDDAAIVTAIIAMAHSLGMKVVAEGVEDASQLAFLRARDCDYCQGYYFSKPGSADEMCAVFEARQRLTTF